ncbi:MAG: F0F1 ATP synthase subunit delta [Betaproteobacteria bacterium]|nr:F0F1 ATP synthase subunit delta [Betaproteobacteria bacterium]
MAEITTIARPYAEAVFKLALEEKALDRWSETLQWLSAVASDSDMAALVGNPRLDRAQLSGVFLSVCEGKLNEEGKKLVQLLVDNHRIPALPAISRQFEILRHQHEGQLDAQIVSAFPLAAQELDQLVSGLEKRFARKIRPEVSVDGSLIGGVKVTVGDVVIDGSVRARIDQMAVALKR